MNFLDLQNRVLDASASRQYADRQTARDITNEAYAEVVAQARLDQVEATVPLTAGQWEYDLLTDLGLSRLSAIRQVSAAGTLYDYAMPIDVTRLQGFGSTAERVYARRGATTFLVYPTPSAGETLTIAYTRTPAPLSGDTDAPDEVPLQFHDAVWLLGAAKACERSREDQFFARAGYFNQRYQQRAGELHAFLDGYGVSVGLVMPRPFTIQPVLDPDQDPVHP